MNTISPKYRIHLIEEIEEAIWNEFKSYPKVLGYIKEWHTEEWDNFTFLENFQFVFKDEARTQVNVLQTLLNMPGDLTLKVAIDLGLETPDFIPSIPVFRNEIKDHYRNASEVFEKAFHAVENDPALAIGLANSALESILKDVIISLTIDNYNEHSTLSELIKVVMKHYKETNGDFPNEKNYCKQSD